ncbi:MAG: ACT domain-containing protein [Chloroflexota bacterium]|nr:ACT domain-containing protein [Chloroflexota bacterium]MDE2946360.1 ACT domain-containing protein [Chloroflexota bacterium]
MTASADALLRQARLVSDGQDYRILRLPPQAITLAAGVLAEVGQPFAALIVDKDEVTLLLPEEAVSAFDSRLRRAQMSEEMYRLITLDVRLDPDLVGFIARIADILAAEGIPILSAAAYSRDHILVPAQDFDKAIQALRQFQKESVEAWK